MRTVGYFNGVGNNLEVKILSNRNQHDFNKSLDDALEAGWRMINDLAVTPRDTYVNYTIMVARPRS